MPPRLTEEEYKCNDILRQEIHSALREEFKEANKKGVIQKVKLENGKLIKRVESKYYYQFSTLPAITRDLEPDKPYSMLIGNNTIDGSILNVSDDHVIVELKKSFGEIILLLEKWRKEYNEIRPHSSIGYKPPAPVTLKSYGSLTLKVVP